ncbi:hypothetical protein FBULB1_5284 [Fusarium bulbicola]|nr:hypothetical protein FBULB1_5284 [Fusarium bulbicola]
MSPPRHQKLRGANLCPVEAFPRLGAAASIASGVVSSVLSTGPSVKAVVACACHALIPRLSCLRLSPQRPPSKYASIISGFSIISSLKDIHRIRTAPQLCGEMWLRSHISMITWPQAY